MFYNNHWELMASGVWTETSMQEYHREIDGYLLLILHAAASCEKYGFPFHDPYHWLSVLLDPDRKVLWKDNSFVFNHEAANELERRQKEAEKIAAPKKYSYKELL